MDSEGFYGIQWNNSLAVHFGDVSCGTGVSGTLLEKKVGPSEEIRFYLCSKLTKDSPLLKHIDIIL